MRSIIITGEINKNGGVTARLKNPNIVSRNEWEFRVSSLVLSAKDDILQTVYEMGSSLNTSECFDYEKKTFLEKNTPICIVFVNCQKNKKQKIDFSESSCPWLKVENAKDTIEISFTLPGTDKAIKKGTFSVVLHLWMRRK